MKSIEGFDEKSLIEAFKPLYALALAEDIPNGDITSELIFNYKNQLDFKKKTKTNYISAIIHSKQPGIIAGLPLAKYVFENEEILSTSLKNDGDKINDKDKIFMVEGECFSILRVERIVLNLLQKLSGIATYTNHFSSKLKGGKIKILDTRKTTLGHRYLEKYAVKVGGGENHRFNLSDEYLIKDNHIDFLGGIKKALSKIKLKQNKKLTLECRSLAEALLAVRFDGIDQLLLDNFSLLELESSVPLIKENCRKMGRKIKLEVSGGIDLENIEKFRNLDVDYISLGALTHSAPGLDLSLKIAQRII